MQRLRVLTGVSVLVLQLGPGAALATPTGAFGNTLQITRSDGTMIKFYINADGSYSGVLGDGTSVAGTWSAANQQLCFTQQLPTPADPSCGPDVTASVGDNWTATRPDGSIAQLTIVAGR